MKKSYLVKDLAAYMRMFHHPVDDYNELSQEIIDYLEYKGMIPPFNENIEESGDIGHQWEPEDEKI
jgi:hypothetical protein